MVVDAQVDFPQQVGKGARQQAGEATSTETMVSPSSAVGLVSPSWSQANRGETSSLRRTWAVFPSCRSPRHRAAVEPVVSPSGRRWDRMVK